MNYEDDTENFEDLFKNQTKTYNNKKLIVGNQMTDDKRFYKTVNAEEEEEQLANGNDLSYVEKQKSIVIITSSANRLYSCISGSLGVLLAAFVSLIL